MDGIGKVVFSKVSFWICLTVSIALLILGFFLPPRGVVDPSVLTAVGEIFAFATLGVVADAIKEGYDAKIKKGELEVNITNDKNE